MAEKKWKAQKIKEKRLKNANKQGMMTVRLEGQGRGAHNNKADDATNPEALEIHGGRRTVHRHVNDAASHVDIDPKRIDLAHMTNPAEVFRKSLEDHKLEEEIVIEDHKLEESIEHSKKASGGAIRRSETENNRGED